MYHIYTGFFPQHCERLFEKYKTDVLRVAPNQLVFNDSQALKDIPGRSDVYRGDFALRVIGFAGTNVSNIRDPGEHRRKRRVMAPGFSNAVLMEQEPVIVMPIVNKLVRKLSELQDGVVNLSDYFDCATSDIIGALSFGANFGMLDQLEKHPFLHVLPNVLRWSVIVQCIPEWFRFMSWVNRVGPKWTTPKPMRGVVDFAGYHLAERKKRDAEELDKSGRKDIISVIEAGNTKYKGMEGYYAARRI
jgi:cytochrome P450